MDVESDLGAISPPDEAWVASQRRWTQGWRRLILPGIFLAYLIFVGQSVSENSDGAAAVAGYVLLALFAAGFLAALPQADHPGWWPFWALCGLLFVVFTIELPLARSGAFVLCLYLTMLVVVRLGARAAPLVIAFALGALLLPVAIPSWHQSIGSGFANVTPIAIPIVALVSFAMTRVHRGNQALVEARGELARLAAENERSRIARDLHDLLGHSLTTITVKAGLARRLGETDPARALVEIAEVENLSRQALSEVRGAVSTYHDVTLARELARGRELLRASGVAAELPTAIDIVDIAHQELFGWAVREGLTNVARHAKASSCAVRLSPSTVEIMDDGVGGAGSAGNGLSGLRDRVAAAGGVLEAGPLPPKGWCLKVSVSPTGEAA